MACEMNRARATSSAGPTQGPAKKLRRITFFILTLSVRRAFLLHMTQTQLLTPPTEPALADPVRDRTTPQTPCPPAPAAGHTERQLHRLERIAEIGLKFACILEHE